MLVSSPVVVFASIVELATGQPLVQYRVAPSTWWHLDVDVSTRFLEALLNGSDCSPLTPPPVSISLHLHRFSHRLIQAQHLQNDHENKHKLTNLTLSAGYLAQHGVQHDHATHYHRAWANAQQAVLAVIARSIGDNLPRQRTKRNHGAFWRLSRVRVSPIGGGPAIRIRGPG